jgi:uncharacterized protein (DUF305 family)
MGMGYSDQHFIVMMIPHHDGAIAMADLALTRARRPEIMALARSIKASQMQENAQMGTWYRKWFGGDVPSWTTGGAMGMGGMGMGMGGMGMVMATSLAALKNAADFDRAFIKQMIPHHRMGVMMASMAQTNSQHQQLRAMQQAMVKAHSQEIEQMTQWYRSCTAHPEARHGFVVHPRHAEILRGGQCRPPEGGGLQLRRAGRA